MTQHKPEIAQMPPCDGCKRQPCICTTVSLPRVHNHHPYRPVCNERRLLDGQLRGACLNDDGSDR